LLSRVWMSWHIDCCHDVGMTYKTLRSLSFRSFFLIVGLVVAARTASAADPPPAAGLQGGATPERHGSAFIDPLGFLMFGPRVGVEAGGAHITGGVYGRWFDPGLLGRSLFLADGDRFAFSYGVGARGRYYVADGHGGLHVGAGAEYLRTKVENQSDLIAVTSQNLVPYAEVGYRLAFERFYAGATAALGYAARLSGRVENLPGGTGAASYAAKNESSPYGSAGLELGVFF
jgi:hypothetical protein